MRKEKLSRFLATMLLFLLTCYLSLNNSFKMTTTMMERIVKRKNRTNLRRKFLETDPWL